MPQKVLSECRVAFGLAFDVQKDVGGKSGFRPAPTDLGSGRSLFGQLRLRGFRALLAHTDAKLVILGGDEGRYKGESPVINRAESIGRMLVDDLGADPSRVTAIPSRSNTGGNVAAMKSYLEHAGLLPEMCGVVSNHYHLPRIGWDLRENHLLIPTYSAEAFLLLDSRKDSPERTATKTRLVLEFGDGMLAERVVEEIAGIADKLQGTYAPRMDHAPTTQPLQ